jgi:hypothetical protein
MLWMLIVNCFLCFTRWFSTELLLVAYNKSKVQTESRGLETRSVVSEGEQVVSRVEMSLMDRAGYPETRYGLHQCYNWVSSRRSEESKLASVRSNSNSPSRRCNICVVESTLDTIPRNCALFDKVSEIVIPINCSAMSRLSTARRYSFRAAKIFEG